MTRSRDPAEIRQCLRRHLGDRMRYLGRQCQLIDLLDDPLSVVLRELDGEGEIQGSQYGDAVRRVPCLHRVPVFDPQTGALSADIQALCLLDEDPPA